MKIFAASIRNRLSGSISALLVFIVIAVAQGGYYIHNIGPLTIPDVSMHALGAYSLATGQSFNPVESVTDEYGNVHKVMSMTGDRRYLLLEGGHSDLVSTIIGINYPVDTNRESQIQGANAESEIIELSAQHEDTSTNFNRSNQYFPIAWLPQAIGIKLGLLLHLNPYIVWQLGRISSFTIFIVGWCLSIIAIPKMKYFLVLIGIIPTTLFVASSLMCDAFLISLCALSVSLTCRLISNGAPSPNGHTAILASLAILVLLIKATYLPICLGFLLLPRNILNTRKKITVSIALLGSLVVYLFWNTLFGNVATNASLDVNQMIILDNPIAVLIRLVYQVINLPGYLAIMNQMYLAIALALVICLMYYLQSSKLLPMSGSLSKTISDYRYIIGSFIAAFASIILILFFLLYTWNNLSAQSWTSSIEGFQGRYILPILPVVCYIQTVFRVKDHGLANAGS